LWQGTPGITEETDESTETEAPDSSKKSTLRYGVWYKKRNADAICEQYSEQVNDISQVDANIAANIDGWTGTTTYQF